MRKITIKYNEEIDMIGAIELAGKVFCKDNIDEIKKMSKGWSMLTSSDPSLTAKLIKNSDEDITIVFTYNPPTCDITISE